MLSLRVFDSIDRYVYEHNLKYHEAKALVERALLDVRLQWSDSYKHLKHDFNESISTLASLSNKTCKDVRMQIEQMYTQMLKELH